MPLVYYELRKLAAAKLTHENRGRRLRPRPWCMKHIFVWGRRRSPALLFKYPRGLNNVFGFIRLGAVDLVPSGSELDQANVA
jgi:hypothetical protein